MHTTPQESDAKEFFNVNTIGALATIGEHGKPHVRIIYYAPGENFEFFFLSLDTMRKTYDLRHDQHVAFAIQGPDRNHTLQIEGVSEEITDEATFGPVLVALTEHLFPEHEISSPLTHLDAGKPVMFRIVPTWVRWGDFTHGAHTNESFLEIIPRPMN